jgi:hypothetical protein
LCGLAWADSTDDFYLTHPEEGEAAVPLRMQDDPSVTVLAEGYYAQGDAGRMGGHPVYLVILEPGTRIVCHRAGRLYGGISRIHVLWTGEMLYVGAEDVVDQAAGLVQEEGELL